uniref:Uncharacterized protein n=1 Tax=Nelumbo nucifera TaxID=4432 RepID=A0A822Y271_NELNU|nr:TPA_asm: hypothetical protein HUJ06_028188 [Nelumbo nucifera]
MGKVGISFAVQPVKRGKAHLFPGPIHWPQTGSSLNNHTKLIN